MGQKEQKYTGIPVYDPNNKEKFTIKKEILHDGTEYDVIYRKGNPGYTMEELIAARERGEETFSNFCPKLEPHTFEAEPGILCERDVCILLRDGTKIYADIFRPSNTTNKVPVIVSWSPFGKRQSEGMGTWKLMGVPPHTVSKWAKFESADPAYWCHHGYAIANVDPRGVGNSEGDVSTFGLVDGRDGYDFTEWVAAQEWCNGKVAFTGNSGVAMVIWRIAAERPPHLACIAPWEGTGDMYRESICQGGIPSARFNEGIVEGIACNGWAADMGNMCVKEPFMNKYWESKIPRWDDIRIPAYVTAGMCHFHLHGSVEGFRRIRSTKKWLRMHREMEWPDTYHYENLEDLKRFFDRYLKDIHNGWEFTPKVRVDVMDAYDFDYAVRQPEREFPLARTEYRKIYLDAKTGTGSYEKFADEAEIAYDTEKDIISFDFQVPEDTEIIGYMKLHLNLQVKNYDNTDMFIWIKKFSADGEYVPEWCTGENYRGAWGYFRASHRELDPKYSTDFQPVQAHRKEEPLEEGKVYPCDIEIWPHSRIWHKGERIRIEISGHFVQSEWYEDMRVHYDTDNGDGIPVIHTGGQYESYLQIPFIPPKYQVGDYIVR